MNEPFTKDRLLFKKRDTGGGCKCLVAYNGPFAVVLTDISGGCVPEWNVDNVLCGIYTREEWDENGGEQMLDENVFYPKPREEIEDLAWHFLALVAHNQDRHEGR